MSRILGIEIGGTKLQLAVGEGNGKPFIELARANVDLAAGAEGILGQIAKIAPPLIEKHGVEKIGIGFGGPVFSANGVIQKSHQVRGWDGFPLASWCADILQRPAKIGNDCDVAGLAEATLGGGRGKSTVFYVTVGTGVGGGLILDGKIHGATRPAAAEIGHLRPGLDCCDPGQTVESMVAGPAIAHAVVRQLRHLREKETLSSEGQQLLDACDGNLNELTTKQIATVAAAGNRLAQRGFEDSARVLGWALAQVMTLVAPDVFIIGGGVSMVRPEFFLEPLKKSAETYSFGPLKDLLRIEPASLGEEVVVHGALVLGHQAG